MFGKILYYDKKVIDEYKTIVSGKKNVTVEEYEISNDKGLKVDLKAIEADAKAEKSYKAKVQESMLLDCYEFERMLFGRDDYMDISATDGSDIKTVSRGTIIKVDAAISIPEEFDMVKLIDQFKPLLMQSMNIQDYDPNSKAALETFLNNAKATKIPIIVETDEDVLCGKLVTENLLVDYTEIAEADDSEMTVLARCSSNGMNAQTKAYYDPLKDFLSLNRMMRKQIKGMPEGFEPLYIGTEYKPIDILAIYR